MPIKMDVLDRCLIVHLNCELDHYNAEMIRGQIDEKIMEIKAERLIFNFAGVNFMDSSGIGVVMGRYKLMQTWGGMVLMAGVNERIEKLMSVSGLRKIVHEVKTVHDGINYVGGEPA